MQTVIRVAMVACIATEGLFATAHDSDAAITVGCYVCVSHSGDPPGVCQGGAIAGESFCVSPCFGNIFNCEIV